MWKKFLAYFLIGLGLLTVTFFRKYTGNIIPYPFVFWITGIVLLWCGLLLIRSYMMDKFVAGQNKIAKQREEIRKDGEKIIVDFSQCEVKENSYTEDQEITASARVQALNALQDDSRNVRQVDVTNCWIIFRYTNPATGKKERFISNAISMDKVTLSVRLDEKKQTSLYVDRKDRENYFFDMSFLSN